MPSKVVRFVFQEKVNYNVLKTFIEDRVALKGKIKTVYTRRCTFLDNGYAYVIFEQECDAEMTVQVLNGVKLDNNVIDVALIGPKEQYKHYMGQLNVLSHYRKLSQNRNAASLKENSAVTPRQRPFAGGKISQNRNLFDRRRGSISDTRLGINATIPKLINEKKLTPNISKTRYSVETTEPKSIPGLRHLHVSKKKDLSDLQRRLQNIQFGNDK